MNRRQFTKNSIMASAVISASSIPVFSNIIAPPNMVEYRYTYTKAGTYKAVFVASNNTIDDVKQVVKVITFTITP